jgi:hypothetical protein
MAACMNAPNSKLLEDGPLRARRSAVRLRIGVPIRSEDWSSFTLTSAVSL